jgi:hypothetical protein
LSVGLVDFDAQRLRHQDGAAGEVHDLAMRRELTFFLVVVTEALGHDTAGADDLDGVVVGYDLLRFGVGISWRPESPRWVRRLGPARRRHRH